MAKGTHTAHRQAAKNLSASGYGLKEDQVYQILVKLSESELNDLLYNCYRTAEKCSRDHLSSDKIKS